jgi:hypothetical protein
MEANKPAAPAKPAAKPKVVVEAYSFRKNGVPYIRKAALTFAASLLFGGALVGAVRLVLLQARPDTAAAQQRQTAARDRLTQAEIERIEIRDFQPRFEQLRARGFVGPENRLAMLEAIQAIQKSRALMPVTFSFAPQQIVAIDPALLAPPLELHATSVRLQMDMLHEMDLVNFLSDLKSRGFFSTKACLVVALPDVAPGSQAAHLNADCTLYWMSVGDTGVVDPNAAPGA